MKLDNLLHTKGVPYLAEWLVFLNGIKKEQRSKQNCAGSIRTAMSLYGMIEITG
jgi:hypothetical protein